MRVLLVEDDKNLAGAIKLGLVENGYVVDWVVDGREGEEMALAFSYDIIILDIMLPKKDGFSLCRSIRANNINTPILVLTARYREDDRVRGLDFGADDYLVKPFSYPELYARIRALIRRAKNEGSPHIEVGQVLLDTAKKKVVCNGREVGLTAKEYTILEYLIFNRNGIVTKQMLEEHIWDCEASAISNVVEVLISRVRKKLCPEDKEAVIKTIKGLGYTIEDGEAV